jgi:hypothetical protein
VVCARHAGPGDNSFPEPVNPFPSRQAVFVGYLDYFRSRLIEKAEALPAPDAQTSRLPSGWTPAELVQHLTFVEMRWLEWGFEGADVAEPWGDQLERRWHVAEGETMERLVTELRARGDRTREILQRNHLDAVGRPGPRWRGAEPPTLERLCLHLLQEYARHLGHLDIVCELAGSTLGE